MIYIKSKTEIELMRQANQLVKHTLEMLIEATREGISTLTLDKMAYEFILKHGAKPSFLHYNGYPASVCISIDDEVVHGIPNKRKILTEGCIVSYDCGVILNGWQGDSARTVGVGHISADKQKLIEVTEQCFFEGIKVINADARLGDVGQAIQQYAESLGYGVVRELCGHGIGRSMHEDPNVPNYGIKGRGLKLSQGMTIAIEPMINMGSRKVMTMADGWTVKTQDGMPSAHYENTIAITENGVDILSI